MRRFAALACVGVIALSACSPLSGSSTSVSTGPTTSALEPEVTTAPQPRNAPQCTLGYDPCLPPAEDYDCWPGEGDGPLYTGRVAVQRGMDRYELDRDGNGAGCEMSDFTGPVTP